MWTLLINAALAGAPTASVQGSDTIVASVSLPAPPEVVRERIRDPRWVTRVDGGKTTVTLGARQGDCVLADYVSPNVLKTVTYTVRQCPTAKGFTAELVEANAFSDYGTTWVIEPEGTGTLLRYTLRMTTTLMVPTSWVQSTTRKSVQHLMEAMLAHFKAEATAAQ